MIKGILSLIGLLFISSVAYSVALYSKSIESWPLLLAVLIGAAAFYSRQSGKGAGR